MKKAFLFTAICVIFTLFGANTYAQEEFVCPSGDLDMTTFLEPVDISQIEFPSQKKRLLTRSAFDVDAPDWLANNFMPAYDYIKKNKDPLYAGVYERLYNTLYNFGCNYSAVPVVYTYTASDGSEKTGYFIAADITDLFPERDFSSIPWSDIYDVTKCVLDDNPQFYYEGNIIMGIYDRSNMSLLYAAVIIDDAFVSGDARRDENERISEKIAEYDAAVGDLGQSNYAIEKKVHDKLTKDITYAYDSNGNPSDEYWAKSIVGALDSRYNAGKCGAYSQTYALLLNRYNVPCYYLEGTAGGGHAWNAVMLSDGEYHYVDTTWDDSAKVNGKDAMYYKFFNMPASLFISLNNRQYSQMYMPYLEMLPECSESTAYWNTEYKTGIQATSITYNASDGYYYYPTPDPALEQETRTVNAISPVMHFDTAVYYPSVELETEAETTRIQGIAANSVKNIYMAVENGSLQYGNFGNTGEFFACITGDSSVSAALDESCVLEFGMMRYSSSGTVSDDTTLDVYIDDNPVLTLKISKYYRMITPAGKHKIVFKRSGSSSDMVFLYNVNAIGCGDTNKDGSVDLTDAIAIENTESIDPTDFCIYDADSDSVLGSDDTAVVLKKILDVV